MVHNGPEREGQKAMPRAVPAVLFIFMAALSMGCPREAGAPAPDQTGPAPTTPGAAAPTPAPATPTTTPAVPAAPTTPAPTLPVAVTNQCEMPPWPDDGTINHATAVEYASVEGQAQLLDIAWPRTPGPHPLVIDIHGGSWQYGDRTGKDNLIRRLAGRGYAAAALDYRLIEGRQNLFPAAAQDVRCAVRWLRQNAARYSIDPGRVALVGDSAGAHLALLTALSSDVEGLDGSGCGATAPVTVQAAVGFAAPTDMRPGGCFARAQPNEVNTLFGRPPSAVRPLATLASPLAHASAGDPPILLIHGRDDDSVPIECARQLHARYGELGIPSTLVELDGVGHDIEELNDGAALLPSMCTFLAFLDAALHPGRQ